MKTIGKDVLISDLKDVHKTEVGAVVIDNVAGTELPKRVRITTGEHAGEVRMLGQYKLEAIFQ